MTDHGAEAQLPSEITLTLPEAGQVLFALDLAAELTEPDNADHRLAIATRRLITSKLWPELSEPLGEEDEDGE